MRKYDMHGHEGIGKASEGERTFQDTGCGLCVSGSREYDKDKRKVAETEKSQCCELLTKFYILHQEELVNGYIYSPVYG